MGMLELGWAVARRPPSPGARPRRPGRGRAGPGPRHCCPTAQAQPPRLRQLNNHNRTVSTKASPGSTAICWSAIRAFSLKPTFQ